LLETHDILIQGSVFEGGGPWEQWFGRMVLTTKPGQHRSIDINIKENLLHVNTSQMMRSDFRTLDVTAGADLPGKGSHRVKLAGFHEVVPHGFLGHQIQFRKVRLRDRFQRECVEVAGGVLHFAVCSSPSTEYHGNLRHLSIKYAHLDLVVYHATDWKGVTGLLPELWGVQSMSDFAKSCLKE